MLTREGSLIISERLVCRGDERRDGRNIYRGRDELLGRGKVVMIVEGERERRQRK